LQYLSEKVLDSHEVYISLKMKEQQELLPAQWLSLAVDWN